VTFEFAADEEYQLSGSLFEPKEGAYPDGTAWLGTGGHSLHRIKVSGQAISNLDGPVTGADFQLWDKLLKIIKDNSDSDIPQTLTLVLDSGNLVLTGWMTNYVAPRRAPDGIIKIDITIDFLIKTEDHSGLS